MTMTAGDGERLNVYFVVTADSPACIRQAEHPLNTVYHPIQVED